MPDNIDVTRDAPSLPKNRIDPDVRIPDSVKRSAAAAEAIHKAAYPEPSPVGDPPADPPVTPVPVGDPPATPAPVGDPPADISFSGEIVDRKKYDAMVASMNGRLAQKDRLLDDAQAQLRETGNEVLRLQVLAAAPPLAPASLITPTDVENYGNELIDVVKRAALEVIAPVKNATDNLQRQVAGNAMSAFYSALDEKMPAWRSVNRDPKFLEWLRLPDLNSGLVRQSLLNSAVQTANAPRAMRFFESFQSEAAGADPSPQPKTAATAPVRTAATTLEALAAPGRAKPAGGDIPASEPVVDQSIITRAQINQFYRNVNSGVYKGNEAEKNRLEAMLFAAQKEGRVRG